jgi:sugar phosphate isomerase/epimerase
MEILMIVKNPEMAQALAAIEARRVGTDKLARRMDAERLTGGSQLVEGKASRLPILFTGRGPWDGNWVAVSLNSTLR